MFDDCVFDSIGTRRLARHTRSRHTRRLEFLSQRLPDIVCPPPFFALENLMHRDPPHMLLKIRPVIKLFHVSFNCSFTQLPTAKDNTTTLRIHDFANQIFSSNKHFLWYTPS